MAAEPFSARVGRGRPWRESGRHLAFRPAPCGLVRFCCEQMLGVRLLSDALGRPGGPPAPRRLSYRLAGLCLVHPSDPAPQAQATGPSCRDLRVLASVFL